MNSVRLYFTVALALIAFAGNSILCRLALLPVDNPSGSQANAGQYLIDPNSFTALRLLSGAITLILLVHLTRQSNKLTDNSSGSWLSGFLLFRYGIAFSFAYVTLDTGIGALILFGSVQLTMILYSMTRGHKLKLLESCGLVLAFGGLVYLVMPALSTPSLIGFILMTIAGIAWGAYTIAGKKEHSPLLATSSNFSKTMPFVIFSIILYLLVFDCF